MSVYRREDQRASPILEMGSTQHQAVELMEGWVYRYRYGMLSFMRSILWGEYVLRRIFSGCKLESG